jgi:hypothetical protein
MLGAATVIARPLPRGVKKTSYATALFLKCLNQNCALGSRFLRVHNVCLSYLT